MYSQEIKKKIIELSTESSPMTRALNVSNAKNSQATQSIKTALSEAVSILSKEVPTRSQITFVDICFESSMQSYSNNNEIKGEQLFLFSKLYEIRFLLYQLIN